MGVLATVGVGAVTAFCVAEGIQRGIKWYLDFLFKSSIQPLQEQFMQIRGKDSLTHVPDYIPGPCFLYADQYNPAWTTVACPLNEKDHPLLLKRNEIEEAYDNFSKKTSVLTVFGNEEMWMGAALVLVVAEAIFAVYIAGPVGASLALKASLGLVAGATAGTITLASVISRYSVSCG